MPPKNAVPVPEVPAPAPPTSIVSARVTIDLTKQLFTKLSPDYSNFDEWVVRMRQLMMTVNLEAIMFEGAPEHARAPGDIAAAKFAVSNHVGWDINLRLSLHQIWQAIQAGAPSARDQRINAIRTIQAMRVHTYDSIAHFRTALERT